jgi:heme oxygenase
MNKEDLEKLIKEFEDLDSKHTLEEIIQSIIDDDRLTDTGKLKLIRVTLEMNKANKGVLEILETELKKTITSYE